MIGSYANIVLKEEKKKREWQGGGKKREWQGGKKKREWTRRNKEKGME